MSNMNGLHILMVMITLVVQYEAFLFNGMFKCPPSTLRAHYLAQFFFSPGYPMGYPSGMDCQWVIEAPPGHQVEIVFVEVLTESCCDIIELRDGNSSSSGLLATYRGNVTESIYVSSFGSIFVRFKTDESYEDNGFAAEYRIATTHSENCTENLEAQEEGKLLKSPGWPVHYENNLHCTWTIKAPADKSVAVTFQEMDTESCCDYVLVRYGNSMNSKVYELGGAIGPQIQPQYISTGGILQVVFRSDSTTIRRGFSAVYKAVERKQKVIKIEKEKCGGRFVVPQHGHGTFTTPRYPMKHANDLKCVWILMAPPKVKIMLWFTSVSTEACCDFIKIRDGDKPTSRKLGVLSGKNIMFSYYVSSSNKLRVDFESDISTASRGFRAVFERLHDSSKEACGGVRRALKTGGNIFQVQTGLPAQTRHDVNGQFLLQLDIQFLFQVIGFHTNRFRTKYCSTMETRAFAHLQ
uniref:deleted in malignant brain tumors 1 protein-like n=1 Tax=Styela clava TaxID=7725 RepID=UPI00193A472D|nr:deleted in malignant brain tumors 1 protein-like [Styela clava]